MDLEEEGVDREKDDRVKQILALRETLGLEAAVPGKPKGYAIQTCIVLLTGTRCWLKLEVCGVVKRCS